MTENSNPAVYLPAAFGACCTVWVADDDPLLDWSWTAAEATEATEDAPLYPDKLAAPCGFNFPVTVVLTRSVGIAIVETTVSHFLLLQDVTVTTVASDI